jgi:hypothetical protein
MATTWERIVGAVGGWLIDARLAAGVMLFLVFLSWVIVSEDRTRHLVSLIRALRQPDRASNGSQRRRPRER